MNIDMKKSRQNTPSTARQPANTRSPTLKLRRVLVPLDFSGKSRQALDFAVPLAKQYGEKIFLIRVVEPVHSYPIY